MMEEWNVCSVRIIAAYPMARRASVAVEEIVVVHLSARSMPSLVHWPSIPSRRNRSTTFILVRPVSPLPAQVSPSDVNHYELLPEDIVALCQKHHCPGIAYTYTEPLTYIEYIIDCARLAHEAGLWNILVTAGYVCQEPLKDLLPYLDAANIDLKSFSDDIYNKVSGGHLQPVLDTILTMHEAGVWIELTNLVIPDVNDDMDMIRQMCRWLVENDLANAPLHFSRFFPRYKMPDKSPTPIQTLRAAKQVAEEEGITHIYLGNI